MTGLRNCMTAHPMIQNIIKKIRKYVRIMTIVSISAESDHTTADISIILSSTAKNAGPSD